MNSLFNQAKDSASEAGIKKAVDEPEVHKDKEETERKKLVVGWVKVNMDGDIIGRKVDLNAHRSYKTLASALELMFMKPSIGLRTSSKSPFRSIYFPLA
jgi:auxin-responsive protein IAA